MICVGCRIKRLQTIREAKTLGWTLWVGGAMCLKCGGKPAEEYDQHHSMGTEVVDNLTDEDEE